LLFAAENVRLYHRLGILLLVSVAVDVVYSALLSVIVTFERGPGQRMLSIGFSSVMAREILIACLVLFISWIMNEGRKLQDEQNLTV
jgi:hypothetical protein